MEQLFEVITMPVAESPEDLERLTDGYVNHTTPAFQVSPEMVEQYLRQPDGLRTLLGGFAQKIARRTGFLPTFEHPFRPAGVDFAAHTDAVKCCGPVSHREIGDHGGVVYAAEVAEHILPQDLVLPLANRNRFFKEIQNIADLALSGMLEGPVYKGTLAANILTIFPNTCLLGCPESVLYPKKERAWVHQMKRNFLLGTFPENPLRWESHTTLRDRREE